MKKRNNNLSKRLLASVIACAMCAGTATTAFAEDKHGEYAYVYVAIEVEERGEDEAPPSFEQFKKENAEAADAATKLSDADTALNTADGAAKDAEEAVNKLEKPVFGTTVEESAAIADLNTAQGAVQDALGELEQTKPEYANPAASEGETLDEEGKTEPVASGEAEKTEFDADSVNAKVDELNKAQEVTDNTVSSAVNDANDAKEQLEADKAVIDKREDKFADDKLKLDIAKSDAEKKVEDANAAVKACEQKKEDLDNAFQDRINALKAPSAAPIQQEGQSEADFVEEYNAWVAEHEAYNLELQTIQTEYDEAVAELKIQSEKAQQDVTDAQNALKKADDDLTAFNKLLETEYSNLAESEKADAINDHNEKLDNYNGNVDSYEEAAEKYKNEVGKYDEAVNGYNKAAENFNNSEKVDKYNTAVGNYTEAVGTYETEHNKYNDAVGIYNEKAVDEYNKVANQWNNDHKSDTLMAEVLEELKAADPDLIQVYYNVSDALEAVTDKEKKPETDDDPLSDPDKIDKYNSVIKKYNEKVQNQTAAERLAEVNKCFEGQQSWETDKDGTKTYWYSLGKIDLTNEMDEGGMANDFSIEDVYTWEYKSGEWQGSDVPNKIIFSEHPAFKGLTSDFANPKFEISDNVDENSYKGLVDTSSIDKWVLTVSNGANNGQGGYYVDSGSGNKNTWHINGYLHVTKLSQLAQLQVRAQQNEKKNYVSKEGVKEVTPITTKLSDEVKLYDKYDNTVVDTVPTFEEWEKRPIHPDDFNGIQLNPINVPDELDVPDEITVTPPVPPIVDEGGDEIVPDDGDDDITIEDEIVPLAETPAEAEAVIDIPEAEVPLAEAPLMQEEMIDIFDEDVPLADAHNTGDNSSIWYALTLTCGLALLVLRKKENS